MSTKVIFRRAEVCLPRRPHAVLSRSQVLSEKRKWRRTWKADEIFAFLSNIRPRLACMRTSRKTDFRQNKDFHSSKNNFCGHDISQGLDREPPSLSPHFLLIQYTRSTQNMQSFKMISALKSCTTPKTLQSRIKMLQLFRYFSPLILSLSVVFLRLNGKQRKF